MSTSQPKSRVRRALAIYGDRNLHVARAARAVRAHAKVACSFTWSDFDLLLSASYAGIVIVENLSQSSVRALRLIRLHHPLAPLVLVTNSASENTRALKDVSVDAIVWLDEVDSTLSTVVRQAQPWSALRLGDAIEESRLPTALRRAFSLLCHSEHPIATIATLASELNCDRSTLQTAWRRAVAKGGGGG